MNEIAIASFIFSLTGNLPELKKLKTWIDKKISDYDPFYDLLEGISKKTIKKYIKKNINFSEKVSILSILQDNIISGDIQKAKENLSELFQLNKQKIDLLIKDFENSIINSGSQELIIALSLQGIKRLNSIDKKLDEINNKSKEQDIQESLTNLIELLNEIIDDGELNEAFRRISEISLDNLSSYKSYKENIVLLESDLIMKMGLEQHYKNQIYKLSKIADSFDKYYNMFLFKRKTSPSKEVNIGEFLKEIKTKEFKNEFVVLNNLIKDSKFYLRDNEIEGLYPSSKQKILKLFLLNLINTNEISKAQNLINSNIEILNDKESEFYILMNELNLFHKKHPQKILSRNDRSNLIQLKDEVLSYESFFADYDKKIKASYYYNLSITFCQLNDKKAFIYYDYFKDDKILVLGFIHFAEVAEFNNEILELIEQSSFKNSPEFVKECVFIKLGLGHFEDISKLDENCSDLDNDTKVRILAAKNIVNSELKKKKFTQNDILLLDEDRSNFIIYIYLSQIFKRLNKNRLTNKYYKLSLSYQEDINSNEKLLLASLAKSVNQLSVAKNICEELFSVNPYAKLLYAQIVKTETNGFHIPSLEVNDFFNTIDINEIVPLELYRIKVEYLFLQGEKDRALILLKWLVDNFDIDEDIYEYGSLLLDIGRFDDARGLIPKLEIRTQTTIIILTLARIYLLTDKVSKLEKFSQYYFLAEKKCYESKQGIDPVHLFPAWFYIIKAHLHISPLPEFIQDNVYVKLREKTNNSILKICIHTDPNLTVKFNEEYLGCKHLHIEDPLISDLMFKNAVSLKYTDTSKKILQNDELPEDLIKTLNMLKDQEIKGEQNYNQKLLDLFKKSSHNEYIPKIINSLEKKYDEGIIENQTFKIEFIDSLWNYPIRYLSQEYFLKHEKYGMRSIKAEPDPVVGLLPELDKLRQEKRNIFNQYLSKNISFYIFASRNYENYVGGIFKLFSERNNSFLGGIGVCFDQRKKIVISYTSILILTFYDKLKFLPLEKLVVSRSLIDEVHRINQEFKESIPIEHFSISLEEDSTLSKYISGPAANRERAKKWNDFRNFLNRSKIIDTFEYEDKYTPFVNVVGKLEIDAVRIASNLQLPLILDDEFIQRMLNIKYVSNILPYYFQDSTESLKEKLMFINELSKVEYRYIIFPNFINLCVSNFLEEKNILLGSDTPFGLFLNIVERELSVRYPYDLVIGEVVRGLKFLASNFLKISSHLIFKEIWLLIPKLIRNKLKFKLIYFMPDIQAERNFIRSCLDEIE